MVNRNRKLTSILTGLLAVFVIVQFLLAAELQFGKMQKEISWILMSVGFMWLLWLAVFISSYLLVSCGTVVERYKEVPSWVNRPDFISRTTLHVLTNWSALVMTVWVAWKVRGTPFSGQLAWLSLVATIMVWIAFNVRHRRMNRARNLTVSTVFAMGLIVACLLLVRI